MPLPLGHIAIGLAAYEMSTDRSAFSRWKLFMAIAVLANLPDIDVVFGLLLQWNGSAFHRGPTHSLLFAGAAGFLASEVAKRWDRLPRMGFWSCFTLILSHVIADGLFSASAVSFFWPLETYWSSGHSDLRDVVGMVLRGDRQDAWIALAACSVVIAHRAARGMGLRRKGTG
ncbi:MAG: metal-dependent hydrolase [Desulfobacterales bacterium]|jgi:inner membrane protein|nr:metal-dependent hydrolase [Desulfobacterales bacterium]